MSRLTLLLIPLIFLSSCTIDWNDEKDQQITELNSQLQRIQKTQASPKSEESHIFANKAIGIAFESWGTGIFSVDFRENSPIKIQYMQKMGQDYYIPAIDPIGIFYLDTPDQKPIDKIKGLIHATGNNPENCEVLQEKYQTNDLDYFTIDLKEKTIQYNETEQKEREQARKDSQESGGPEIGITDALIYNRHLKYECGTYAIGIPPATSKTYGSFFLAASGSVTLLYHPAGADPSFINLDTLQLSNPQSE